MSTSETILAEIRELLHIVQDQISDSNDRSDGYGDYSDIRFFEGREGALLEVLEILYTEKYGNQ